MPVISNKGLELPDSPIRKLTRYANAAKERGVDVIHLNIGQPDIDSPSGALEAIRNMNQSVIEYSPSEGFQSYRNGLSAYYGKVGVDITADDILVTTGGSEALIFAFLSCLNPGDEIIIPEPFYANYNALAGMVGARIVNVTASIDNGFALPPMEEFEALVNEKTKAILICNPGNPTGANYSNSDLDNLAELVKKHDLYLFADEVYREFTYLGDLPRSIMSLSGLKNHAVMIDSVSKRYSMCGARIGCLVTRCDRVRAAAMKFAMARLSPPTVAQIAAEAALQTEDSYFDEVRSEYMHRRDTLVRGLNLIDGVECPLPEGAFYAVAKLPVDDAEDFCQWLLESFVWEDCTVMITPNAGFYATPGLGKKEVRLAYVLNVQQIKRAVHCLGRALQTYPGRTQG